MSKAAIAIDIDYKIATAQQVVTALLDQLKQVKGDSWEAFQAVQTKLEAAQNHLTYWQDYKGRNPIIWEDEPAAQPGPELLQKPLTITLRQLYQAAAGRGYISQTEALAGLKGEIPKKIMDTINSLPGDTAFKAQMLLLGSSVIDYGDSLTNIIGQSVGLNREAQKAFFDEAAKL